MNKISIITPAYNEEDGIIACIDKTIQTMVALNVYYEYIIVNDGSTDKTEEKLLNHYSSDPNIKLINKKNGGFGSAVKEGIKHVTTKYLICIPADNPLDVKTAMAMFHNHEEFDLVLGYRAKRNGYSFRMKINSYVFHLITTKMFKVHVRDFNWIHLYNKQIFDIIVVESNGMFMLAEVIIKAKRFGFKMNEVEVNQVERLTGLATAAKLSSIVKTVRELLFFYVKQKN